MHIMKGSSSYDNLSAVLTPEGNIPNLTSENYIGMSSGTVFQTGSAASTGTKTNFETGVVANEQCGSVYVPDNNKIVIVYGDSGNSAGAGTAVVGTVSGTSISFGTPAVFRASDSEQFHVTYDTTADKLVLSYNNKAVSSKGTAIVGTISGTDITFGAENEWISTDAGGQSIVYDTNTNRTVIAYNDDANPYYGKAVTVSGTSNSFGSIATFESVVVIAIIQQ